MGKIKSFKQEFTIDERRKESQSILVKYPDRVPVIIEKYSRTDLPEMDKKKYVLILFLFGIFPKLVEIHVIPSVFSTLQMSSPKRERSVESLTSD
ncbi:hypothetical protein TSUD_199680 [Trifolium subterraneum]|nr:hypothetical protein TSUD_199680 [Trifolium subterraneum]